jgi:hypothetical protein
MAGSNPAEGMDIILSCLLCCAYSGLCNELIRRSEESYRVCVCVCARARLRLIVCDLEASKIRRPIPDLSCGTTENVKYTLTMLRFSYKGKSLRLDFQAPAAVSRYSFFWDVTQSGLVVIYRHFGKVSFPFSKAKQSKKIFWTLKM